MRTNEEIRRGKEVEVKAIDFYSPSENIVCDSPILDFGRTKEVIGEGLPTLLCSLRLSQKYGKQLELQFTGKRKVERMVKPSAGRGKTFGKIYLERPQLNALIQALQDIEEKWEP